MLKKSSAQGFTLIEVVVVLTLLGILASIAGAKYFDLQEQARIRASETFVAEVQARINAEFAANLLEGKSCNKAKTDMMLTLFPLGNGYAGQHIDGDWSLDPLNFDNIIVYNSHWDWLHVFPSDTLHFPECSSSGA